MDRTDHGLAHLCLCLICTGYFLLSILNDVGLSKASRPSFSSLLSSSNKRMTGFTVFTVTVNVSTACHSVVCHQYRPPSEETGVGLATDDLHDVCSNRHDDHRLSGLDMFTHRVTVCNYKKVSA
ncbi:hypothetical protein DFS33DRAFT_231574 [Desarmillaria ectypa]|nr:hypothetical protein DFS33DRAFT_231574 [Desarmillaria ectypa]